MRIATFVVCCAAVLAAAPLFAQGRASSSEAAAEAPANARSGVRFVICSPSNAKLPSPLYYRAGKDFRPINISSRTPSPRIRPTDGRVDFWEEDPSGAAATKGAKGNAKAAAKDLPKPTLSVAVPDGSDKLLCIVVPSDDLKKTQTYFLKEKDFPKKGLHIINFSSFPLKMTISEKGDFTDPQEGTVGVFRRDEGISKNNTWSYVAEEGGKSIAFMLAYKPKDSKEFQRLRASRFTVSPKQSQINVVVKDPTRDIPKLLPIQLMESK